MIRRLSPYAELGCALLAGVLWYLQGGAVWYAGRWPGPWPLLLLAAMWGLIGLRVGFRPRLSLFDLLLGIFVLSALVGTQTAYAPGPAWAKFWLVAGAWGLAYALIHQPDLEHLYWTLAIWGGFGVALTAYFFLTHDWSAQPIKSPELATLGAAISARLPALTAHRISPNVTGGMLAAVLPLYVPLTLLPRSDGLPRLPRWLRRWLPVAWAMAAAVALLGLLVTVSRGAWMATLAGFALWALWWALGRRFEGRARLAWMAGLVTAGGVLAAAALAAILTYGLPGAGGLANRLSLLRASFLLARDYVMVGAGLGTFEMNFSVYTLLIHVGYIVNSHNMVLDVAIEQGLLGAAAYLGLVAVVVIEGWQRCIARRQTLATLTDPREAGQPSAIEIGQSRIDRAPASQTTAGKLFVDGWQLCLETGLVSLAVVLVHGLVDDVLYGSRGLLLLFLPLALVHRTATRSMPHTRPAWRGAVVALALLLLGAGVFWRPLLAQGYASWGAMRQARMELARYVSEPPSGFVVDTVRQEDALDAAVASFDRAIALNPTNATALQRLAGVHLSRREYAAALQHMEAAWEAGHRDAVTRLLLGDALIAFGRVEEAVSVIDGVPFARSRLLGQAWARYHLYGDWDREAWANQAAAAVTD